MPRLAFLFTLWIAAPAARAQTVAPPAVQKVDIEEHLGGKLPLDLHFTDQDGRAVQLADYFTDGKPVILALAYYGCPALCGLLLHGLGRTLLQLSWRPDAAYRVITVSFDPRDRPGAARLARGRLFQDLNHSELAAGWPFLVGDRAQIAALADALGFRYGYDQRTGQYAHAAVLHVLTPGGTISRYLYGVELPPRDLRLALVEAGQGRIGTIVDRLLLTCYQYDPATRRYGIYVLGVMRGGALLILLTVAALVGSQLRKERRRRRAEGGRA